MKYTATITCLIRVRVSETERTLQIFNLEVRRSYPHTRHSPGLRQQTQRSGREDPSGG
jgi:hypothetical protein